MSLFLGQMLHRAVLALLFELNLASLRRLTRCIGCIALIVDEAGAFVSLISESCHFLAQLLQIFDGQPVRLDIGDRVGQLMLLGVEYEVPGRHSILVSGLNLRQGFCNIVAERVFAATSDGKVSHIDDSRPAEALEWVCGRLERLIGSDECEVVGGKLTEALVIV